MEPILCNIPLINLPEPVEGHGGGEDQSVLMGSMTTIYKTKIPTIT
jgi:hypothetical protein